MSAVTVDQTVQLVRPTSRIHASSETLGGAAALSSTQIPGASIAAAALHKQHCPNRNSLDHTSGTDLLHTVPRLPILIQGLCCLTRLNMLRLLQDASRTGVLPGIVQQVSEAGSSSAWHARDQSLAAVSKIGPFSRRLSSGAPACSLRICLGTEVALSISPVDASRHIRPCARHVVDLLAPRCDIAYQQTSQCQSGHRFWASQYC